MVALTADRNTTARLGDTRVDPVAAAVRVWAGSIVMRNAAGDLIVQADVGMVCFILNDQTVAKTDGTGTWSRAGIVDGMIRTGVRVRFDEAVTRGA